MTGLRFHWRLLLGGEDKGLPRGTQNVAPATSLPEPGPQADFCRAARDLGIDSLLVDFGYSKPDPVLTTAALGMAVPEIGFIVAHRSGLMSPVAFVQQFNTLSVLIGGRVSLNIVAGHSPAEQRSYGDFLDHDRRYARTDEYLAVCHALWQRGAGVDFAGEYYRVEKATVVTPFVGNGRPHPEIFIAGNSDAARRLAVARGTCWMRLGDTLENVAAVAPAARADGVEVGLRFAAIARPTRAEAVEAAHELIRGLGTGEPERSGESTFVRESDSVSMNDLHRRASEEWLSATVWAGAVRTHGAASIALVGSAEQVAEALLAYGRAGVSQFILSAWPKRESMEFFGRHVIPLVRERERREAR
jgi:alkanesulfonate monooxygenase